MGFIEGMDAAPGGLDETVAAVKARFIVENGAQVVGGHSPVGTPTT